MGGLLSPRDLSILCSVLLTIFLGSSWHTEMPGARVNFPTDFSWEKSHS